jgi:chromosome partitioning protein
MRKIVINNQKGGSGKTTTAVNISAGLADKGKKVLLVDLDPGASSSIWLLGGERPEVEKDLFDLNSGAELITELSLKTTVKNLDIIPFSPIRYRNTKTLKDSPNKSQLLKKKFQNLPGNTWDYVIFDCAPGLNLSTVNALAASDELIIPVVALLVTNFICSLPEMPASIKRCAPEKVIYPPTVPPTLVTMAMSDIFSGIKV